MQAGVTRVIAVAGRLALDSARVHQGGLRQLDALCCVSEISLPNSTSAQALEFIVAVLGLRDSEFTDVVQGIQTQAGAC